MKNKEVIMTKKKQKIYFKSTGRVRRVPPRMLEYLRNVIDTPTAGFYVDNGKAPDEIIGQKMCVCKERVGQYRKTFAKRYFKEEVMELCEEIMKEAA